MISATDGENATGVRRRRDIIPIKSGDLAAYFSKSGYWGIRAKAPAYAELIDWTRGQRADLFAVPPYDNRFTSFRYLTGKGVYAHQSDINQLSYSPDYYYKGFDRLLKLGLVTVNSPKYKWQWGYENHCAEITENIPADYSIFEKHKLVRGRCGSAPVAYENAEFVVYENRKILSTDRKM